LPNLFILDRPTVKGWPFNLGFRDRRFNFSEDRKGLTRGTHIEQILAIFIGS
jgi:hypothetical protein